MSQKKTKMIFLNLFDFFVKNKKNHKICLKIAKNFSKSKIIF